VRRNFGACGEYHGGNRRVPALQEIDVAKVQARTARRSRATRHPRVAATLVMGAMLGGAPAVAQTPTPPAVPSSPAAAPATAVGTVVTDVSRGCWYVYEAANGEVWFGSDGQGVYRWQGEGKPLVNFTTADGLAGNGIRGIQGDKAGNVYFTTFAGISRFDGRAFTTLPVAETPADGGWRLHPDDLWFQWFTGMPGAPGAEGPYRYDGTALYHLDLPKSDLEPEVRNDRWSPYEVYSLFRDSRGHIWIGTGNYGVCHYDGNSFGWLYEEPLTMTPEGGSIGIRSIIEDEDGAFWITNAKYRFQVKGNENGKVVSTREPGIDPQLTGGQDLYFQGAVMDAAGDLWLSPYGGGVWRFDGKCVTNYPVKDTLGDGKDTQMFCIFKGNAGGLWLGTPTAGPFRFNGEEFQQFRP
jgi:hypothetical protein